MADTNREPSMDEILASIRKVIDEEQAPAAAPQPLDDQDSNDVLELSEAIEAPPEPAPEAPPPGEPLVSDLVADASRQSLAQLSSIAASAPPPAPSANPLEEAVREMLRPLLRQWLDDHLPRIVDEHVRREISRITGRPL